MKTTIKKISMLTLLFFAFAFARAGFIPHIASSLACHNSDGKIVFSQLQSDGPGPFTIHVWEYSYINGFSFGDSSVAANLDSFTVNGLAPGKYYFTVGQNSSYNTFITDTITVSSVLSVHVSTVSTTCLANNGSISLAVSGGSGTYSYLWGTGATTSSISALAGGRYAVTVSDAGGCSSIVDTSIYATSPVSVVISNNNSVCNPTLTAAASGTTGTVTYNWSTGATGTSITAINGYNYYGVTATDANGCTGYNGAYFYVTGLRIDSSASITSSSCANNNGSITVSPYNGTPPFTYLWSNGSTAATAGGLASGTYYVTVTDSNGCSGVGQYYVSQVSALNLDTANFIYPSCNGSTGSISVHVSNGVAPFTFLWSTGATDSIITGLAIGTYSVTVHDAIGCSGTRTYYLNSSPIGGYISILNYPGCTGASGRLMVYPYGGSGSYTYLWSTGATTDSISNLAPGPYSVTVTDISSGCTGIAADSVYNSSPLVVYFDNLTNPTCGSSNGTLGAIGYYGSGNYSYAWSTGSTAVTITGLSAGIYTVTATDLSGGCTASGSYQLIPIANFQVAVTTTPTACDTSLHTGTATAIVTGAGTGPYSYTWTGWVYSGGTYHQDTIGTLQTISNLAYGSYIHVVVTDANGCSSNSVLDSTGIGFDPACYDHIVGYLYNDANGNCVLDAGEHGQNGGYVYATDANGTIFWGTPDSTGFYNIEVLPGTYTVHADLYGYSACTSSTCVTSYTDTFTVVGQISSGNNFAVTTGSSSFDLGVHPGCTVASPGGQKEYWIYYFNDGLTAVNNAVVTFTHDPSITLVSTNPPYSNYNSSTHVITWNVGTVYANFSWNQITMEFDIPSSLSLGTVLYAQAEIDPIPGDCNPNDNIVNISDSVAASHDPNEKQVSPAGNLSESDSVLTYTIRFQNTGNAPASRVVISDTLSSNVDPGTIIAGAASAPYTFKLSGNGILTFTFNNINLPDSSHGDSSKGFVTYTVHTKRNLPLGAQVSNTAFIYFDLNPAIVTNTTVNVRSDHPNGIDNITNNNMSAQVVPNPAHDITLIQFKGATGTIELRITDALGNTILSSNVDNKSYTLDAERLSSGIYFYMAKDANGNKASGKISVVH